MMYEPQLPYILHLHKNGVLDKEETHSAIASYIRSGDVFMYEVKQGVALMIAAVVLNIIMETIREVDTNGGKA